LPRKDFGAGLPNPSLKGGFEEFREVAPSWRSRSAIRASCSAILAPKEGSQQGREVPGQQRRPHRHDDHCPVVRADAGYFAAELAHTRRGVER